MATISEMREYEEAEEPPEVGPYDFERIRKIGAGDVGRVYIVRRRGTQELFAMKVLSKEDMLKRKKIQRCLTEREVLSHVDHPCIVSLYYTFNTESFLYFVMDYCAGGEFFRMLRRQPGQRIPEEWVRFYAAEVLMALQYLHTMGFIYRDLKPENILLHATGHIMLTDFDLAAQAESGLAEVIKPGLLSQFKRKFSHKTDHSQDMIFHSNEPHMIRTSFVGTPEYIAPEVLAGSGHSSSVDWWTFGVLLFEMTFGKTPYAGRTEEVTFQKIAQEKLTFPEVPLISKSLRKLIKHLLKRDVKKRLGSHFGASEIMKSSFFKGVTWQLIRNMTPPFLPELRDELDTNAFMHVAARDHDPVLDAECPWAAEAGPAIDADEHKLLSQLSYAQPKLAVPDLPNQFEPPKPAQRERFLSCPQVVGPPIAGYGGGGSLTPVNGAPPKRERFQSHTLGVPPGEPDPFEQFGHSEKFTSRTHHGTAAPRPLSLPRPDSINGGLASPNMVAIPNRLTQSQNYGAPGPASPSAASAASQYTASTLSRESSSSKSGVRKTAVLFYVLVPKALFAGSEAFLSVLAIKETSIDQLSAFMSNTDMVGGKCGPYLLTRHKELVLQVQIPAEFGVRGNGVETLVWTGNSPSSKVDFWVTPSRTPGQYTGCVRIDIDDHSHSLGFNMSVVIPS